TYDLGHQPFGLASPQAWLKREGHQVQCRDLSVEKLDDAEIATADLVAIFLPMHTATRLALAVIERIKLVQPKVRMVCYGLYAELNAALLRECGVQELIGGEFEAGLVRAARGEPVIAAPLEKLALVPLDRTGLPPLVSYAHLRDGDAKITTGYTE